jgi:hypothetical protein
MQTEDNTPKARRWASRTAALAAAVATLMIGSIAAATWTLSGTGTGAADATTALGLTVSIASPDDLYPGLTTDVTLTVSNPNAFAVEITAVTFTGDLTVTPAAEQTCSVADSAVTFNNQSLLSEVVAAGAESTAITLTGAITMGTGATDGCQGASFSQSFDVAAEISIAP